MRHIRVSKKGKIKRNTSVEGLSIEKMLELKMEGKEELGLGSKTLGYTIAKDGIIYGTDIRGDRFEHALEAMDYVEGTRRSRFKEATGNAEMRIGKMPGQTETTEGTTGTE